MFEISLHLIAKHSNTLSLFLWLIHLVFKKQAMEAVPAAQANKFYTITNYLQHVQEKCYNSCVVDFQSKDIQAMEKECAQTCIRKHMAIYKDMAERNW